MQQSDFLNLLQQVNIPWRFAYVEEGINPPFGIYTFERKTMLFADNKPYAKKRRAVVDVYASTKAELEELAEQLELAFENSPLDFSYDSSESFDLSEHFYLISYTLEV